jgi:hypothetical protein
VNQRGLDPQSAPKADPTSRIISIAAHSGLRRRKGGQYSEPKRSLGGRPPFRYRILRDESRSEEIFAQKVWTPSFIDRLPLLSRLS